MHVTEVLVVVIVSVVGSLFVLLGPRNAPAILVADSIIVEILHALSSSRLEYVPWLVTGVVVLLVAWRRPERDAPPKSVGLGLLAFLYALWAVVVCLVHLPSDRPYLVGIPFVLLVTFWALPRLVSVRTMAGPFVQLLGTTAVAGAVLALSAGVAALHFHIGYVVPVGHRHLLAWQWPFANKNTLGYLEAWAVPAAAGLAVITPGGGRALWWLVALMAAAGLGFSYARTAWIAAVVGVLLLAIGRWRWSGVVGVLVVGLIGAAAVIKKAGLKRLTALWAHGLSGRGGLWRAALTVTRHHPVFGVGPGNSPAALAPYVPPAFRGLTPHDAILETLVELGIPGLILLAGVVIMAIRVAVLRAPTWQHGWALIALLGAGLTEMLAESAFFGGVSFEDYLVTALLAAVVAWSGNGMGARARRSGR